MNDCYHAPKVLLKLGYKPMSALIVAVALEKMNKGDIITYESIASEINGTRNCVELHLKRMKDKGVIDYLRDDSKNIVNFKLVAR